MIPDAVTLKGMSSFVARGIRTALALAAVSLLAAGCASNPAPPPSEPGSTAPGGSTAPDDEPHVHTNVDPDHLDVAWLDGGSSIALITWGSSTPTCRPVVSDASADGQTISLTLSDRPEASEGCDADLTARGDLVATPGGVDPSKDVTVSFQYEQISGAVELDGLDGDTATSSGQAPSAGWFGDDGIALLSYGSSSCRPKVSNVQLTEAGATVTFSTTTGMCTMDMAPRVTPILLPEPVESDGEFELTLSGDSLDATIPVIG